MNKHHNFLSKLSKVPDAILSKNCTTEAEKLLEHRLRIYSGDIWTCEMILQRYWEQND